MNSDTPGGLRLAAGILFGPTPVYEHATTLRVVVLYDATGTLRAAAEDVGLEVVHTQTPTHPKEQFDFEAVPSFDLVLATIPSSSGDALHFSLRFLRVRRPWGFAFVGEAGVTLSEPMARFREQSDQLGYQLHLAQSGPPGGRRTLAVGTPSGVRFSWPDAAVLGEADTDALVRGILSGIRRWALGS